MEHPTPADGAAAGPTEVGIPPASGTADDLFALLNPEAIPTALLIGVAALVLVRVIHRILTRTGERVASRRLLLGQISTFVGFGIYLAAAILAVALVVNLSPQALFALSGSLAVMLGFALKDVAASVLASFTILVTRPFQVGDRVSFGGYYGEVKDIGLRSVRVVTLDDNLVTIPSSKVLTDSVASANAGALDCMVVVPLYVDVAADAARAKQIVEEAILSSRYLYLGKPFNVLTAMRLQGSAVLLELTAKAYVYDARHERSFASEVTELALAQFQKEGIALPVVPHPSDAAATARA